MAQANHIEVVHGSLTVDVPRRLFKGPDCILDEEAANKFKDMIRGRYPWLTENSVEVLMKKARKEMIRVLDEETNGRSHSSTLADKGKLDEAIAHMRLHIEQNPDDADSWYTLGELLCKTGNAEEGYKALNHARALAVNKKTRR